VNNENGGTAPVLIAREPACSFRRRRARVAARLLSSFLDYESKYKVLCRLEHHPKSASGPYVDVDLACDPTLDSRVAGMKPIELPLADHGAHMSMLPFRDK